MRPNVMRVFECSFCSILLVTGLLVPSAAASSIVSNLGAPGTFDTANGWVVDGGLVSNEVVGNSFSVSQTATLLDVQLALGIVAGRHSLTVYLQSNSGGLPGRLLTTLAQNATIGSFLPGNLVEYGCNVCPVLQAGSTYWLVAQEADASTIAEWALNDTGDVSTGDLVYNQTGSISGPWTVDTGDLRGAFEVQGTTATVVPEPASILLLSFGVLALGFAQWHSGRTVPQ